MEKKLSRFFFSKMSKNILIFCVVPSVDEWSIFNIFFLEKTLRCRMTHISWMICMFINISFQWHVTERMTCCVGISFDQQQEGLSLFNEDLKKVKFQITGNKHFLHAKIQLKLINKLQQKTA